MKPRARRLTLVAGAALVLLTNAVALGGVWWNRSAPAESTLALGERELGLPWRAQRFKENSGLALDLRWRVIDRDAAEFGSGFTFNGGAPEWLDAGRMAALGFTVGDWQSDAGRRRYTRQPPRQVVVVLELAGPAWQRALAKAGEEAQRHAAAAAANPNSKEFANRARRAQESLAREETANSRLFAVDAGLDAEALRRQYPDRGRFMLLHGTIRPAIRDGKGTAQRATGHLAALAGTHIHVPHPLRGPLEALGANVTGAAAGGARFNATIVVGRRLEPWIAGVETLSNSSKLSRARETP